MIPKNRPPFAPNLAQKAKQPQQRAHGFKPVVAQLKTVAPAQNVKLPPQSIKVLQTRHPLAQQRQVGPTPRPPVNAPVIMRKPVPTRPVAPPVYKPQPAPKVMQQKSAAGSPKPLFPAAAQLKVNTQHARPANMPVHAATTRPRVLQMAKAAAAERKAIAAEAEAKAAKGKEAKITAEGLAEDDYLYVEAAGGGNSKPPAFTESKMTVRVLRKSDVDYKLTATFVEAVLNNPTASRNTESDCPIHMNSQGRLPNYSGVRRQPNLEYVVKGLGGSRIVVDLVGKMVYLSHHYGDSSAQGKIAIPKFAKKNNYSAFVELDPATWNLIPILVDARKWWDSSYDDPPGH